VKFGTAREALGAGCDEFDTRPIELVALLQEMDRLLDIVR
jgi:hypothetical protein